MKASAVADRPPVSSRTIPRSQVRRETIREEKTREVVRMMCSRGVY
jgi:hypothetical protein